MAPPSAGVSEAVYGAELADVKEFTLARGPYAADKGSSTPKVEGGVAELETIDFRALYGIGGSICLINSLCKGSCMRNVG